MTVLALTISLALSLLVGPRLSQAQAPAKMPRVGILTAGPASHPIFLPRLAPPLIATIMPYPGEQCYSLPKHCVFTQSGAWFGAVRVSRAALLPGPIAPGT
jgi:hypothetical protein